ncbi:ABC transporter substrate-binding protein [Clostridium sp. 'deep sea']|uniref:ABC transporter substrate-binding protein n=1 Tax=Clostridium sp. 'deep sea' TaxID=2779445 RepID=UPI0018966652|nr:ABC transporter substrate-binding protein [Clostridium sp. 'deep sea']QOR36729.1 ABC transporter substrate-binding protein [Clostridium sp. 'deep sea']
MKNKLISLLVLSILITGCLAGCTNNTKPADKNTDFQSVYPEFVTDSNETSVTYVNVDGESITVTKKPKKVVVLLNSILDLWYLAGGESIARVKGTVNVPTEAADLPILGSFATVSAEAVMALEPDLVLLSSTSSAHKKLYKTLSDNNIECAPMDTGTQAYTAFQKNLYLMTEILGTQDIFNEKIKAITDECNSIIKKAETISEKPNIAVLYVTSKSIRSETQHSLTGEMLDLLGAQNIIKGKDIPVAGSTRVDFSLEVLAARDPQYLFICTMGDVDACKEKVAKDIKKNAIWSEMDAVKNNRVYYLPKENYVYKPNAQYPEALSYLAKIIYPETFK